MPAIALLSILDPEEIAVQIYLLRHGIAEYRSVGMPDSDRRLTAEGIAEMQQVANALQRLDLGIQAIISSPYLRARETAEIVAERLFGKQSEVTLDPRLESGELRLGTVQAIIGERTGARTLMFVGHEPDLSMVAAEMIGGGYLDMKKAGLARIDTSRAEPGAGVMRWLLTPRVLLGRGRPERS